MNIGLQLLSKTLKTCKFISQNLCRNLSSSLNQNKAIHNNAVSLFTYSQQPVSLAKSPWPNLSHFSSLANSNIRTISPPMARQLIPPPIVTVPTRSRQDITIIKWDKVDGSRLTNMDVIKRFRRLDWGIWIRPRAGANTHLWKKRTKRVHRLKQNVFCNATQCRKLDKMVTSYWRTPRVYADDPYAPYMKRDEFRLTRGEPLKYN